MMSRVESQGRRVMSSTTSRSAAGRRLAADCDDVRSAGERIDDGDTASTSDPCTLCDTVDTIAQQICMGHIGAVQFASD